MRDLVDQPGRAEREAEKGKASAHGPPGDDVDHVPPPRSHRLRLSPLVAIAIASIGLALVFGLDTDRFGFHLRTPEKTSLAEAVDISLQRLMRSRVAERLRREHRLHALPHLNRTTIDGELGRIRERALYAMIKDKMTDHLRNEGYHRVPIKRTMDPKEFMLSAEAENSLNTFIHSLRASFPAPNEKVATFLEDMKKSFGDSIVAYRADGGYDVAFTVLIRLIHDYPDDLEPVAAAVRFLPRREEEIERSLRGEASGSHTELRPFAVRSAPL
jgi:hypothetical protein